MSKNSEAKPILTKSILVFFLIKKTIDHKDLKFGFVCYITYSTYKHIKILKSFSHF